MSTQTSGLVHPKPIQMTISVVECADPCLLTAFSAGIQFQSESEGNPKIEQGQTDATHWLIIEDERGEDNATYTLTAEGLTFSMSGVEI